MLHDFAIIGAGIAGASVAAELASHGRVILIEAEDTPGYHATGRSAAFWSETYGGPLVQPLTSASGMFLEQPPADFSGRGFLTRCGALHIANAQARGALDAFTAEFKESAVTLDYLDEAAIQARVPGLRESWNGAVLEPSCADIDVGGLHQAYLRAARKAGVELRCGAPLGAAERRNGVWTLKIGGETVTARTVINAAGAWADHVARLFNVRPISIVPHRRTVVQVRTDPAPPADLPLVIDAAGKFYFKAEAGGRLWLSPHDEVPEAAGDTAPEEIDVAVAIDRFQQAVNWQVLAVERKWAGQRSFAPDRLPVYGFDPDTSDFFWCAGQGGFGIQTAPAAAKLCKAAILNEPPDASLSGVDPSSYLPGRFR